MQRPLAMLLMLMAATLSVPYGVQACEKHLSGHQQSSDTNREGAQK